MCTRTTKGNGRFGRPGLVLGLAALLATASLLGSRAVNADEPADVNKQLQAHLAAGEFGPARALAQMAPVGQQDAMNAAIAAAQLRAGARGGFANTLRGIGSDQVRSGLMPGYGSGGMGAGGFAGGQSGYGFVPQGGAAMADFTALMELIQSTTGRPNPGWEDDGGVGRVEEFPQGVLVDASGLLKKGVARSQNAALVSVRSAALESDGNRNARKPSNLRKISLTRLERELQLRRALGQPTDDAMRTLAGLQRIQYVLVYPETGDIVIAGPAGDWKENTEGRLVSADSGRPTLQLDDLIVLLRNATTGDAVFGCSINPRNENLVKTKQFIEQSTKQPLKPGDREREAWVSKIRELVGVQDINVFGVDPRTRVARVIVEADYRMKLVGMGLEEGVPGVTSYLDALAQAQKNGGAQPIDVLRWWFTVNYDAVQATESHDAFEWTGQGVKVLSENELLTERGDRVHTGKSDELNSQFARSFTKHFSALAAKYPVYAELQNVFDLALVAAIIRAEDLGGQTGWHMTYFGNPEACPVELGYAPKEVESVVNHRVVNRTNVVLGVSGGVSVDVRGLVSSNRIQTNDYGKLEANRKGAQPKNLAADAWWWD